MPSSGNVGEAEGVVQTFLWFRAETRPDERRCALTPQGAAQLIKQGFRITVEDQFDRVFAARAYRAVGCEITPSGSWTTAPQEAFILGLKELPDDGNPLRHQHIMFGHAFKGQHAGQRLLQRFAAGGGALLDLEYLTDSAGRRVAAFGYWAGYAGAGVTLLAWAAQQRGGICGPLDVFASQTAMLNAVKSALEDTGSTWPTALVIGALGRVGRGVADLCAACNVKTIKWDMAETAKGGPFEEILQHDLFFNCVLATDQTPPFIAKSSLSDPARRLAVIGDIACDPDSDYNPVPVYSEATNWQNPVVRVADKPVLDVMAVDNLPSLLPQESSENFAEQLLPHLAKLGGQTASVWDGARAVFKQHLKV